MPFNFTDYSGVRVVLGVSPKELSDSTLSEQIYSHKLALDLVAIDPLIEAKYVTAMGETTPEAIGFVHSFNIFTVQALALYCATSLPLFSPKSVTDGKSGFSRDSSAPYQVTIDKVEAEYDLYAHKLKGALSLYVGGGATSTPVLPMFGISSPLIDPVTGS